jgi:hypothetical protein
MQFADYLTLFQAARYAKTAQPAAYLTALAKVLAALALSPNLHWSATDEGKLHLDPFPNPQPYLIAGLDGHQIAIYCGPVGVGIGPEH